MGTIANIWQSWAPFQGQLISFALSAALLLLGVYLKRKPDLRWGLLSNVVNNHELEGGDEIRIDSASHLIQNVGGAAAKEVQIVFNYEPSSISLWPQQEYETSTNPEHRHIVKLSSIGPKETVTINSVMIGAEHPIILTIKTPEGLGKQSSFKFYRDLGKMRNGFILVLLFLGFAFVVNFLLVLVGLLP